MAGICLCQYKECPKSQSCKRYLDIQIKSIYPNCYADFKQICNKDSNYEWYWKVEKAISTKEDINE